MSVANLLHSISLSIRQFLGYQKLKEQIPGLDNVEAFPWYKMTLADMAKALEQYRETGENINYLLGNTTRVILDSGEISDKLVFDLKYEPNFGLQGSGLTKAKITAPSLPRGFGAHCELSEIELINVTEIPIYCFSWAYNLSKIIMEDVTSVGYYSFEHCNNLETITLPSICKRVEYGAFRECIKLKTFSAEGLNYLGPQAFLKCSKLEKIEIGSEVEHIWEKTFKDCTALNTIIINTKTVSNLRGTDAFEGTPIEEGTGIIYVPDNLVDTYKITTNWVKYSNQIKPLSEYVEQGV